MNPRPLELKHRKFSVLLGNEFDINVGLKKRRKRSLEDEQQQQQLPGPETFLKKFLEIISKLEIADDEIRFQDRPNESGFASAEKSEASVSRKNIGQLFSVLKPTKKKINSQPAENETFL